MKTNFTAKECYPFKKWKKWKFTHFVHLCYPRFRNPFLKKKELKYERLGCLESVFLVNNRSGNWVPLFGKNSHFFLFVLQCSIPNLGTATARRHSNN